MKSKSLKSLQTQLTLAKKDVDTIKVNIKSLQRDLSAKFKTINDLSKRIKEEESSKEPTISEHALLRYCERVKGIDLKEAKKEILDETIVSGVKELGGSGKFPHPSNTFSIVFKNYKAITIHRND